MHPIDDDLLFMCQATTSGIFCFGAVHFVELLNPTCNCFCGSYRHYDGILLQKTCSQGAELCQIHLLNCLDRPAETFVAVCTYKTHILILQHTLLILVIA